MGNYASIIRAKMKDIKECVETLFFHIRWILAHGEIVLLYAEDLSVYVRRRHRFHPADHRKLDDISEADCIYGLFSDRTLTDCTLGQTVVVARCDIPRAPMPKHPIKRCHLKKGVYAHTTSQR
jgi:hypothetical protein